MTETNSPEPPAAPTVEARASTATTENAVSAILQPPSGTEPAWAKPGVALLAMTLFAAMIAVAYCTGDTAMKTLLGGAAVSMATTAVQFYLGSSSGSDRKTGLLAIAPPANSGK